MTEREFRCPSSSILVFALLLAALPGLAAADEVPRISPQARAAFEAVVPPQAKGCGLCASAHQHCSATCFSFGEKEGLGACLTACDNAAATCTCDQTVSLRSEDLVSWEWPSMTKAACHAIVSCQPNYPSCAGWSSYSNCGDPFCGVALGCGECVCDEFGCQCEAGGPAMKQFRERFRVCFNQAGNSCTEWQRASVTLGCGC
jgi:hypothetical protein